MSGSGITYALIKASMARRIVNLFEEVERIFPQFEWQAFATKAEEDARKARK